MNTLPSNRQPRRRHHLAPARSSLATESCVVSTRLGGGAQDFTRVIPETRDILPEGNFACFSPPDSPSEAPISYLVLFRRKTDFRYTLYSNQSEVALDVCWKWLEGKKSHAVIAKSDYLNGAIKRYGNSASFR